MRTDKHYITRPMRPRSGYSKFKRKSSLALDMSNLSISEAQAKADANAKRRKGFILAKKRRSMVFLRKHREKLAQIAQDTLHVVLTAQSYEINGEGTSAADTLSASGVYDLSRQIRNSREESSFYPHHCALLAGWAEGPPLSAHPPTSPVLESSQEELSRPTRTTKFEFVTSSTLSVARKLWLTQSSLLEGGGGVGVLNFAYPKRAGGACLNGGEDQEECIVRQSTLYDSLQNSDAGVQFYATHRKESDGSGLHDHAMLYSPNVVVFKDDEGKYIPPYTINVVSSVPVNAATVRTRFNINEDEYTEGIRTVMTERMARILRLFEERGDRVLVLGAFGVGQCCNSPSMIGEIWADLLYTRNAKFQDIFDRVIFALPAKHARTFQNAFESRWLEMELSE